MGRPREHAEDTRDALRTAAEALFDQHGIDGVSVRAVADAVGTTTRAVYSLFGSRDGLLIDAMAEKAYAILEAGLDDAPETDDPAGDLVDCAVNVFRRFVCEHPALFRVTFQRIVPGFQPGPELIAARQSSYRRLVAKVARLEPAGMLAGRTAEEATLQFQALCDGLGNFELRGATLPMLPDGAAEDAWRAAFTTLVIGLRTDPSLFSAG